MSWNSPARRFLLLFAALGCVAITWHLARRANRGEFVPGTLPRGSWKLAPPSRDERPQEDSARVLSLPYVAATRFRADGQGGVVIHDRARASAGVNLYVSGDAPEARLIDLDGRELHRWGCPFERAFPGKAATLETPFFRRAEIDRAGNLYALYQGGGLVVLDRDSRLIRKLDFAAFNDFALAEDGTVHLLIKSLAPRGTLREKPIRGRRDVLEDSIVVVDSSGRVTDRISLLSALLDSPFASFFEPHPAAADVLHANTIEVLRGPAPAGVPWLAAGNLLVSLREIDTIGVVDPQTRRFVWAQRGPWDGQHQPTLLSNGRILLFDNRPHERFSRLVEFDPRTGEIAWLYPADPKITFTSPEAGSAQRLPNGNTLVTESDRGRAFEITPLGEIVWEFRNPHRAGPRGELVARLFEVVRYPASFAARSLNPLNPSRSQSGSSREKSGPR